MKKNKILFLFCISFTCLFGQSDSLTLTDFINYIKAHHPLLLKYQLTKKNAEQELLGNKGQLDPALTSAYNSKSFDGKEYFNLWESNLKIPTWFGPDFKIGYEANSGSFLNLEDFTPNSGLVAAGISVPIGQNMIIDERRNTIKQARIFVKMADAEQQKLINKFILSAIKDYWEWYFEFNKVQRISNAYNFAKERYAFSVSRISFGDMAPIDSVEASIQMQNMNVSYNNAQIEYYNATMQLNTYLWKDNTTPLELDNKTVPKSYSPQTFRTINDTLQKSIDWAQKNNPEILKSQLKIDQVKVEQLFSKNKLLPKINVDYAFLSSGTNAQQGNLFNPSNFKLSGNLYMPLLLRKERGKLNQVRIKLLEANFDFQQTIRVVDNDIKASLNECNIAWNQIQLQKNIVVNSVRLRNAEKANFDNGESSLFLINTREQTLLSNEIKYFEFIAKYQKSQAILFNNIGFLGKMWGL